VIMSGGVVIGGNANAGTRGTLEDGKTRESARG
jgi:hypothetical protein